MDSISEGFIKTLNLQVEKAFLNLQTLLRKLEKSNNDLFSINDSPLFGRALSYREEIISLSILRVFSTPYLYSILLSSVPGHSDFLWLGQVKRRDSSQNKVEGTSKGLSLKEKSINSEKSKKFYFTYFYKGRNHRKIQTQKAKFKDVLSIA